MHVTWIKREILAQETQARIRCSYAYALSMKKAGKLPEGFIV